MNREIEFRGKTEYDGSWVEGNLVIDNNTYYIYSKENIYPNMKLEKENGFYVYIVDKETIRTIYRIKR